MFNRKILIILLIAAVLGFYHLGSNPPALSWDEAAVGWNAKTIFHTRRDEYGIRLPLSFKSFGDYKAPLYIYLTAPVVGLLGVNELSTRLVSVLAGIASVFLFYLIVKELIPKAALWSALLLAVSPWHLLISRPAFEPNLALMFILAGILFFLKSLKQGKYLLLSALAFIFSLYSYQSPKIFVPIFLAGLAWLYRRKLFSQARLKTTIVAAALGLILLLPLVRDTLINKSAARFQGIAIFSQPGANWLVELPKNYLIHFSPQFLFFGGDNIPRVQMRQVGSLLLIEAPFLLWGLIYLLKRRRQTWAKFLLWWLLAAPLPAMIGFEVPHPIRAYQLLPVLTIIVALGLGQVKKRLGQKIVICLFIINTGFFIYHYFHSYPIDSAPDWQYGYKQAVLTARNYEDQVEKIIFTSYYGQPHIFTYFYQQREPLDVFWGAMIKYTFRNIKWDEDQNLTDVLLVGSAEEIPAETQGIIKEIKFPDGQVAFRLVKL